MERKKASDFPQELLDEFHLYVHGDIDRRTFLDRAGKFSVGGLTADDQVIVAPPDSLSEETVVRVAQPDTKPAEKS